MFPHSPTYMQRERAMRSEKIKVAIINTFGMLLGGVVVAAIIISKITQ